MIQKRKPITAVALLEELVELAAKYPGKWSWLEMLAHMAHDGDTHYWDNYMDVDRPTLMAKLSAVFYTIHNRPIIVDACDDIFDIFRSNVNVNIQYIQDLAYLALDECILQVDDER